MVLDFDVKTFCQNLRATKPPYECPVKNCGKIYKSFCGIQFHLYNYDHENPTSQQSGNKMKRKKGRWHPRQNRRSPTPDAASQSPSDGLRFREQQKMVEVDLDGQVHQLNICEPLDIVYYDGPVNDIKKEVKVEDPPKKPEKTTKTKKSPAPSKNRKEVNSAKEVKLPEAVYRIIPDYEVPNALPMPIAYFRFIEKSAEELDEDVEYDMDEEDCIWLEMVNQKRAKDNAGDISADTFELLMDRLEKESYFQSQNSGKDPNPSIDEDAVCCICNDGECQNSNAILFCDMCNLAVHQECYGVPYIPEGQWLCRRCLQSPSRAVDCVLCPNKGGAFKQTDDGRWAHVVCALWIPEVCFANTVFLEPLDNIENIPPARWKLTCYICKQRSVGACIQCHKANCYTAFHVTCAQQAGLHMKMEAVRESGINGTSYNVRKTAYCDVHAPVDADSTLDDDSGRTDSFKKAKAKAKSREKMRKARKILAEKRSAVPVVSLPTIPPDRLTKISSMVSMSKKHTFLERLVAYWTLKRQSRNGVPLLRRLQTINQTRRDPELDKDIENLGDQLKYWQRLRQDLEKARLLVELIRKREKLKREYVRADQLITEMKVQPLLVKLREVIDQLNDVDLALGEIFAKPVDLVEVPDYLDYIKRPMDLQTMLNKLNTYKYDSFDNFEDDFNLMIKNCLTYNSKDTVFYKAALKMREQGSIMLRDARTFVDIAGFNFKTGLLVEKEEVKDEEPKPRKSPVKDTGMKEKGDKNLEEQLRGLQSRLVATEKMKHGISRSRRAKQLRIEITTLRRKIAIKRAIGKKKNKKQLEEAALDAKTKVSSDKAKLSSQTSPQSLTRTRHNRKKSEDPPPSGMASAKRTTRAALMSETKIEVKNSCDTDSHMKSPIHGSGHNSKGHKNPVLPEDRKAEVKEEVKRPVGRPPRKCPKFFEKASPPPPSLSKSNVPDNKSAAHSPPILVNSSSSVGSARHKKSNSSAVSPTATSKGASPPVLKPQIPFLDTELFETKKHSPHKDNEATSPTRASTRIRSQRGTSRGLPKGRVVEVDFDADDEHATGIEIKDRVRFKHGRSKSRLHSGSSTPVTSRKSPRKSRYIVAAISSSIGSGSSKRKNSSSSIYPDYDPFLSISVPQTDSFKFYRSNSHDHTTDSDNKSGSTSEGEVSTPSSSAESYTSSDEEGSSSKHPGKTGGPSDSRRHSRPSHRRHRHHHHHHQSEWNAEEQQHLIPLQPLDLVWAKCRGYPWYPALIISPDVPHSGYFHNGVPIPIPPKEVLALKENYTEDVFLVLFFDTKRTWQWLLRDKLAPLGVDSNLDKARLVEPKKTAERKAVKKAFENAILHRCRVTGESNSISGDSGNDN